MYKVSINLKQIAIQVVHLAKKTPYFVQLHDTGKHGLFSCGTRMSSAPAKGRERKSEPDANRMSLLMSPPLTHCLLLSSPFASSSSTILMRRTRC